MSCCAAPTSTKEHEKQIIDRNKDLETDRIIASSVELEDYRYKTEFIVPDMHCAGCIGLIERGLAKLSPTMQVRANLSRKSVTVIWNKKQHNILKVSQELHAFGFEHHLADAEKHKATQDNAGSSLLLALAVAGFAAANVMLLSVSVWSGASDETALLFHLISGLVAIPAVMFAGQPFFHSALKALSARRLNMDVPISLAVLLALCMSIYESLTGGAEAYFDASITLLFFLLIGRYLDYLMRQKARGAVERLTSLSTKNGVLIHSDGELGHIDLKDIRAGMRLRIFAGERFPVNGRIISGKTELDRSHVTGESDSVLAQTGEIVEAGTLNLTASIDIEATSSAETSFLAEMRKMMEIAEKGRGEYTRIADRMAQIYAPAVHLLALMTFIIWMILSGGDWHISIYTAIAVLIITCPCALGLAVPVAHVIGANRLMQNGILMRDGTALERLANINNVIFDKTGTLTKGKPVVTRTYGKTEDMDILKALASKSAHPVSKAIDDSLREAASTKLKEFIEVPGFGIEAEFDEKTVRLGKPNWVGEISKDTPDKIYTASFAVEDKKAIHFKLEDEFRDDVQAAIKELKQSSMRVEILSGDNADNVSMIAGRLDVEDYHSSQTPAEKINCINSKHTAGQKVLMVGDGINDAPALAAAHVSMVPSSASDVGRYAADFIFTRSSLTAVPFAFEIAKYTAMIVKQNFGIAIAYNCIAIPLAMSGFVTPLFAAIAMSASSIVVIANSLRINLAARQQIEGQATSASSNQVIEVPA